METGTRTKAPRRIVYSTTRINGYDLEFGSSAGLFYIAYKRPTRSIPKGAVNKWRVRMFQTRQAAVTFGHTLKARLSQRTRVVKDVRHFGRIVQRGPLFVVEIERLRRLGQKPTAFMSKAAALAFFEAKRTLSQEELEQEERDARYSFLASQDVRKLEAGRRVYGTH